VGMGMEIDAVAGGLDAGHNPVHKLFASRCLEVFEESLSSRLAEWAQEFAVEGSESLREEIIYDKKLLKLVGDT
jgi:hypothetical protein